MNDAARTQNTDTAEEPPLSPYYSHEACGFHWYGRDGADVPMKDGQPVCPRCELATALKRLGQVERRREEVGTESRRRGRKVLEQSQQIRTLERTLDDVRRQLGQEILRAGDAVVEDALRLLEAVHRARGLGWRTVTVDRFVRIANGDDKAMPPDPATAPRSARGTYFA